MVVYRVVIAVILAILFVTPVGAEDAKNKGLFISPLRKDTQLNAGIPKADYFTIGNLTEKPMTVNLSVKEFSVSDFAYDYKFASPQNDWVKLGATSATLQPNERKQIWYEIVVPPKTAPGGHYFTIFASANLSEGGLPGTVQAATLIYLTVDGKLIRTSVLQNDSIPWFVMGREVPYKFDVKDTGNVHFSAYFFGQLQSIFGEQPEVGATHLLMPGAVRTIEGSIPTPLLPGIYSATYGYKVDFADIITAKTTYIVFVPPWSVAAAVFLLIGGRWWWQKKRK